MKKKKYELNDNELGKAAGAIVVAGKGYPPTTSDLKKQCAIPKMRMAANVRMLFLYFNFSVKKCSSINVIFSNKLASAASRFRDSDIY